MSVKNKKQFGVWMDSNHAAIVGMESDETGEFAILGHVKNDGPGNNSNENTFNNAEKTLQQKYFKEIAALMQNAEEIHVTGTGTEQEQFIRFLSDTAQFKNTIAKDSTSNKMSDENLIAFISEKFK